MDLDFRASIIRSSNHLSSLQASHLRSDSFGGESWRAMPMEKESNSRNEVPQVHWSNNLDRLKLELSYESYVMGGRMNENWGAARYRMENEAYDGDDSNSENYSVDNYTERDEDTEFLFHCPFCGFEIEVSVFRSGLGEVYNPKNTVCPVCDEKLGEDAIGIAQHSSSSRKRNWKFEKSSISSDPMMLDNKIPSWGRKHEPVADTLLSPFGCNMPVPNPSAITSEEDSLGSASDISNTKSSSGTDATDLGDEQDREERRQRASFVQELVLSTLSLEI